MRCFRGITLLQPRTQAAPTAHEVVVRLGGQRVRRQQAQQRGQACDSQDQETPARAAARCSSASFRLSAPMAVRAVASSWKLRMRFSPTVCSWFVVSFRQARVKRDAA